MDPLQKQIDSLCGETLALQIIVGSLSHRLAESSPQTFAAVRTAFDDAAGYAEQIAITFGKAASPEHTVKALRIVEQMRAVAIRDHSQPRGGV